MIGRQGGYALVRFHALLGTRSATLNAPTSTNRKRVNRLQEWLQENLSSHVSRHHNVAANDCESIGPEMHEPLPEQVQLGGFERS